MNRREFVTASVLAGGIPAARALNDPAEMNYYEMRHYHMPYGSKQRLLHDFLRDAFIPAVNRVDVSPVGVFHVMYGPSSPSLHVLMPHRSLASVAALRRQLEEDQEYQRSGAEFLSAPLSDPAYVRYESMLLRAFESMPKVEVARENPGRVFELRTYESHSEAAGRRKIEMFDRGGELPIFRKTGLTPVFFGETLIGPKLPNLVYMLVFEDMRARDEAWTRFGQDPDWEKLRSDAYYADTVSTISDVILRPTGYSQI